MVTVQLALVPAAEQSPDQPVNCEFGSAAAVRVTELPMSNEPDCGTTVPVPVPVFVTASANCFREKVALVLLVPFMIRVQVVLLLALQSPDQPAKVEFGSGAATSVTFVPSRSG